MSHGAKGFHATQLADRITSFCSCESNDAMLDINTTRAATSTVCSPKIWHVYKVYSGSPREKLGRVFDLLLNAAPV